ncbi:NAD(P)/FAD-dependent oxidoreductase [Hydrogenimonas sp.]
MFSRSAPARYDTIVAGAGIAGVSAAYWLGRTGRRVLLLDKKGLLAGASGAAGAFLSPRLGRGGDLQQITNEAYRFALAFYSRTVPEAFFQKGLVRIPKDRRDAQRFSGFEPFIDIPHWRVTAAEYPHIAAAAMEEGAFYFPDAAFVDPMTVARKLTEGVETAWGVQRPPRYEGGLWRLGRFSAPELVLATGADPLPVPVSYLRIGGLWGERVDLRSEADIPVSLHRNISVSANIDGTVRVGATHVRNDTRSEIERINRLIVDAVDLVPGLSDQHLVRIYAGYRSSVADHFPLAGPLADAAAAKEALGVPRRGFSPGPEDLPRIRGCYIIGGFGGRGFVFAPWIGKMLADSIASNEAVDPRVSPDRFLLRYLRRGTKS